jgi:putative FmdB family regulatory protein
MPQYDFLCEECRKPFAVKMSIAEYEKARIRCPKCKGAKVKRQITGFRTVTSRKS